MGNATSSNYHDEENQPPGSPSARRQSHGGGRRPNKLTIGHPVPTKGHGGEREPLLGPTVEAEVNYGSHDDQMDSASTARSGESEDGESAETATTHDVLGDTKTELKIIIRMTVPILM